MCPHANSICVLIPLSPGASCAGNLRDTDYYQLLSICVLIPHTTPVLTVCVLIPLSPGTSCAGNLKDTDHYQLLTIYVSSYHSGPKLYQVLTVCVLIPLRH